MINIRKEELLWQLFFSLCFFLTIGQKFVIMFDIKQLDIKLIIWTEMERILLERRLSFEMHSLNNLIKRRIESSEYFKQVQEMTGTNSWIISYLAKNQEEDIFQKDLQERFSVTRSTASKVLSLMEEKGLIVRKGVASDARLKKIVLTKKAIQMHEAIEREIEALETNMLKGFSNQELQEFYQYIERMKKNIRF